MNNAPAPREMLPHFHKAISKTLIHLTAYRKATSRPKQVRERDVPDFDSYDFTADRTGTDEMLQTCQQILTRLEQHRTTYYPELPAFEESPTETRSPYRHISARLYNTNEACTWILVAEEISLTYAEAWSEDAPAFEDAWRLADDIYDLLHALHAHAFAYTMSHGVHSMAYFDSRQRLDELNPLYTTLSAKRERN